MPIFRVKSVKIYTGKKNLHGYTRGIRDKLEVWYSLLCFVKKSKDVSIRMFYLENDLKTTQTSNKIFWEDQEISAKKLL